VEQAVNAPDAEDISRTTLLVMNAAASSLEEAEAILASERIVLIAGTECATSIPHQAALLTAANTARRAVGNVPVIAHTDTLAAAVLTGPLKGMVLSDALERLRATPASTFGGLDHVIVIGTAHAPGATRVTWAGWTAAVRTDTDSRLAEDDDMPLAPIAAAALAVSEAFQRLRCHPEAGHRDVTLSLWDPTAHDSTGLREPRVEWLPSEWVLLGLGHLGQANAWGISFLPYADTTLVHLRLQDADHITRATLSTGLLTFDDSIGKNKTRIVSAALERLGFATSIIEQRLVAGDHAHDNEPQLALIGVDNVGTRRLLSDVGWKLCVDAGLGRGVSNYTSIRLQAFPGSQRSDAVPAWLEARPAITKAPDTSAYHALRAAGVDECGLVNIADKAVAVTFVGAIAACLAIAEPLRALHDGPTLGVQTINLSSPAHAHTVMQAERMWVPPATCRL
jgi:hypothetical protein